MRFCRGCHASQAAPLRPIAPRCNPGCELIHQGAQLRNVQRRCFAESVVSQATREQNVAPTLDDSLESKCTASESNDALNVEHSSWAADGGPVGREGPPTGDISLRVGKQAENVSDAIGVVYGLHRKLPQQVSWEAALHCLASSIQQLQHNTCACTASSGSIRLEVEFPATFTALDWLLAHSPRTSTIQNSMHGQGLNGTPVATAQESLQVYFSPRHSPQPAADAVKSPTVAGMGATWLWKGEEGEELTTPTINAMQRFMHASGSDMKVLGGARFDSQSAVSSEWEAFGSFCMVLPALELVEGTSRHSLVVNLVWDADCTSGKGPSTLLEASEVPLGLLSTTDTPVATDGTLRPLVDIESSQYEPDLEAWHDSVSKLLDALQGKGGGDGVDSNAQMHDKLPESAIQDFLDGPGSAADLDSLLAVASGGPTQLNTAIQNPETLQKVVLARCMQLRVNGQLPPLAIVKLLQLRDAASYQFAMILPEGSAFVSATPERLFIREGRQVTSEAVAGTRRRGCTSNIREDFELGMNLLSGMKEHNEFVIVREWVQNALTTVCSSVSLSISKSLLKLRTVQHLYGRLSGEIAPGRNDADLLGALHPTPAVCGCPQEPAYEYIRENEAFDRGFYAGPLGYISADSAEFVVGIRSALISPAQTDESFEIRLFSGVGIVPGSCADEEWKELNLKASQYLRGFKRPPPLASFPNVPAMHAGIIVDELVRCGVSRFAVAPGSRSSPLMHAIHAHPHAIATVMLDERSLGFWAVGAATATLSPVAIVTTSGTAVANLLPAVVEASNSQVPLMLLTADRPSELQQCGSNQTIDQVKIFGDFVRHACNLPPPEGSGSYQPASTLTQIDAAVRHATQTTSPGPVHINCQFRDPLAPVATTDSVHSVQNMDLAPLSTWDASSAPYTSHVRMPRLHHYAAPNVFLPSAARQPLTQSALLPNVPLRNEKLQHNGVSVNAVPPSVAFENNNAWSDLQSTRSARSVHSTAQGAPADALQNMLLSQRGVILAGEIRCPQARSALFQVAKQLGWPIIADVLSGLRVGAASEDSTNLPEASEAPTATVIHHMDTMLTDDRLKPHLAPEFVLQIGEHVVSKRIMQFFTDQARMNGMHWMHMSPSPDRHDERHVVTSFLQCSVHELHAWIPHMHRPNTQCMHFMHMLSCVDKSISSALKKVLTVPTPAGAVRAGADAAKANSATISSAEASSKVCEPLVAYTVASHLPSGHALFAGNSMPIRDLDMFTTPQQRMATMHGARGVQSDTPVAANRGASGIDGVISSAAGFASGLHKPTTLLIGDVSFMHDSNGLMLLRSQPPEAPVTVVLVNNSGGGIFSFLPISSSVPEDEFTEMWATPPNVDLKGLCRAHHIPHTSVTDTGELLPSLQTAWALNSSSVVEVTTSRSDNVSIHRALQSQCTAAAWKALNWNLHFLEASRRDPNTPPSDFEVPEAVSSNACIECISVREMVLPLRKPVTTGSTCSHRSGCTVVLRLRTASGKLLEGSGEASPLPGLHIESHEDAAAQLATLTKVLKGIAVPANISLLDGELEQWWEKHTGVAVHTLHASVRFAVESALVAALAQACGAESLAEHLYSGALSGSRKFMDRMHGRGPECMETCMTHDRVAVSALMDLSACTEQEVEAQAVALQWEGYSCIKVKVGRNAEPETDADLIAVISAATGSQVSIRADANRLWTLDKALRFAARLQDLNCSLEYLEEPVQDAQQIEQFVGATGLAVAVDESLDDGAFVLRATSPSTQHADGSNACVPVSAVSAVVIKPSLLGSLEQTCKLLRWGADHGVKCVISSSFESPVGLAAIGSIAAAADAFHSARNPDSSDITIAHGLGTLSWFKSTPDDVIPTSWLPVQSSGTAAACMLVSDMHDVHQRVGRMHALHATPLPKQPALPPTSSMLGSMSPSVSTWDMNVQSRAGLTARVRMLHIGGAQISPPKTSQEAKDSGERALLFLHGFMGAAEDWVPVMHGMAACGYQCYAMDLPCHGRSSWEKFHNSSHSDSSNCTDASMSEKECEPCIKDYASVVLQVADVLQAKQHACSVSIVGYSLGARVALEASAACQQQGVNLCQVVAVSASPGIRGASAAQARRRSDACTASLLRSMRSVRSTRSTRVTAPGKCGKSAALFDFLESWYSKPLWASLRQHPRFSELVLRRARDGDPRKLADALEQCSSGRQNLWPKLLQKSFGCNVSFIVGSLDSKFLNIAKSIVSSSSAGEGGEGVGAPESSGQKLNGSDSESAVNVAVGVKTWPEALPYTVAEVQHAGHAVHEEQPAALVTALQHLLKHEKSVSRWLRGVVEASRFQTVLCKCVIP